VAPLSQALADDPPQPPISIGAGMRTDFEYNDPTGGKKSDNFNLDSIRLYVSGYVMDHVSFMFNYLNGTYYGDKDLLAIGVDGQTSDGNGPTPGGRRENCRAH